MMHRVRIRSAIRVIVVTCGLAACSDSTRPPGGDQGDAAKLRDGIVISGPLASVGTVSASGSDGSAANNPIYVSMPPGTLTTGDTAQIDVVAISAATGISVPMGGGGFDPVPVLAKTTDSIDVAVFAGGTQRERVRMRVPASRQPSVVRTTPARGRTDVPLNQSIFIVFSQPLNASTINDSSIELLLNGAPVAATFRLQTGQPWVVIVSPAALLAPDATYTITVSTKVTDANGASLSTPVNSAFTTSGSADAVTSIAVRATGGYYLENGTGALAAIGGVAEFVGYELSARGDTLWQATQQPLTWSSSNEAVATVVSTGLQLGDAKAISAGSAVITACLGSICGTGTIVVHGQQSDLAPTEIADLGGQSSWIFYMSGDWATGASFTSQGGCRHAMMWSQARGAEDLGTLPGECSSVGYYVSSNGVAIGFGDDSANGYSSWWEWKRESGIHPLTFPTGSDARWYPIGIDAAGDVAFSSDSDGSALVNSSGASLILSVPQGAIVNSVPNDRSEVTLATLGDQSCDALGCWQQCGTNAYVWDYSAHTIGSTLSPRDSTSGAPLSICAWRVNNSGWVIGSVFAPQTSFAVSPHETGFRWSPGKGFEFAPDLGAGVSTEAFAINEAGDAAMYIFSYIHIGSDSVLDVNSAVWMADGRLIRLGSLGGNRNAANGINDAHLVLGHSQVGSSTGPEHAVLWDLTKANTSSASPSTQTTVRANARSVSSPRGAATSSFDAPPESAARRNSIHRWSLRVRL